MNKMIFGGVLGFLMTVMLAANAQQPNRYIRKPQPAPGFFVPQKDTEYQEKLPPFIVPQDETSDTSAPTATHKQIKHDEPIFKVETKEEPTVSAPKEEFNPNLDVNLPEILPQSSKINEATPKYKQEYAAYLRDLKVIAETGQAPHNPELVNDLAKMTHDQRLEVDNEGRIVNPFQQSQLVNPMAYAENLPQSQPEAPAQTTPTKILDQVEIVRRPPHLIEKDKITPTEASKENPFAQQEEAALMPAASEPEAPIAPETAAHFGGINPFVEDEQSLYEAEPDNGAGLDQEDDLAPLPLLENAANKVNDEEEPPIFQPEPYQPEPQISRSYNSGRGRASSSSYSRSSNIIR